MATFIVDSEEWIEFQHICKKKLKTNASAMLRKYIKKILEEHKDEQDI